MSLDDLPTTAAEELALLVDSTVDYAMFVLDTNGLVATWNRGGQRIKGYDADEIVGRHFSAFYTEEDRADGKPARLLATAERDGRVEDEGWRVRKDGTRFWANVVVTAIRDGSGALRAFGKVTRDLTVKREHAQTALRLEAERAEREAVARSEEWLKTTLRSIGDAVIATDATGRVVFMNPVAELLTGWTEAEARGVALRDVFRIVNEYSRAEVESPVDRVLRDGMVVGLANHTILIAKDGAEHPIDDSGAPIRHGEEGLIGVVLVFRDIAERKAAEDALARAHERMTFLAEASTVMGSSVDYEKTLANVAQMAIARLADWCSVEIVGGDPGDRKPLAVAHVDPARIALAELVRTKYPPDSRSGGVYEVVRTGRSQLYPEIPHALLVQSAKDEEHLRLILELGLKSAMIVPMSVGDRVAGAITFVIAESDRRFDAADLALAEELGRRAGLAVENARLYEEAARANRTKDDFLATLSHELRTPLNAILGWAHLLRGGKLAPAASARALETIERNARLQAQLINDVLDVSRIVSGKLDLELEPLDLDEVVRAAVEAVRPAADARELELECHIEATIQFLGDAARLQQVVANLLTNAIKFTPARGRVVVTVDRVGERARIRVADDGVGIAPDFLPHLFERFRQADSTTRRAHGGLGIGLSIVRSLVEGHGGRVEATSDGSGRGATFTVHLPIRSVGPSAAVDATPAEVGSLHGIRVLVVDDEPDARELVQGLLAPAGAEVRIAGSGADALDLLRAWTPDVLVSDIGMPGMDGFELIRRVRALDAEVRAVPAIALTAYASVEDRERVLAAGFQLHLPKPLDPTLLGERVQQLAGGRR